MKYLLAFFFLLISLGLAAQNTSLLSQKYSGKGIQILEVGSISTNMGEYSPFFDINYNELYFMRRTPGKFNYTIYQSKLTETGWSVPKVESFSGKYRDAAPYISPDGMMMLFDSKRPSRKLAANSINIWYSKRVENQWTTPKLLEVASINSKDKSPEGLDEYGPAIDQKGIIYFYSFRNPYRGGMHYKTNGPNYNKLEINRDLPDPSYKTFVSYSYISPNGRFALLEGRAQQGSSTDIYYSCKNESGQWYEAIPLSKINSIYGDGVPSLTADGKFLLFASNRPSKNKKASNANLYIVETKELFGKCQKSLNN